MGNQLLPTKGEVFVPTHLRVLQVSQDPMLVDLTLMENLTFGDARADRDRVIRIMRRLNLHEGKTKLMDKLDDKMNTWYNLSTSTEIMSIHLARALVANPEVLILHRPMLSFDEQGRAIVRELLHDYVEHRGVELPADEMLSRRLRTCIISTADRKFIQTADMVLVVKDHTVFEATEQQL